MNTEFESVSEADKEWTVPSDTKTEKIDEEDEFLDVSFYITDHSARHERTGNSEQLENLYTDVKKDGVNSVRYDWDWNLIQEAQGMYDVEHLERFRLAKETMDKAGLEAPTIVLSNIPKWALELYKKDKEAFFDAFKTYAETVRAGLEQAGGSKVDRVQLLNEFNNKIYNPIATEDLPRMADITREVFHSYNENTKIMGTVIAGNTNNWAAKARLGTGIKDYLPELKKIKDSFDVIAVDYYPGLWQTDLKKIFTGKYPEVYKDLGMLKDVFNEISSWGKEYELGEVGLPTNKLFGDEKNQRYFYDTFFRALRQLLVEFKAEHKQLPNRIGLYEAVDETPQNRLGKMLNPVHPEFSLGMRRGDGERKMVLQGNRHTGKGPSQLQNIIRYFKRPIKTKE